MYSPKSNEIIDIKNEKEAIIEYFLKHWNFKNKEETLIQLVDMVFDYGKNLGENTFKTYPINKRIHSYFSFDRENKKIIDKDDIEHNKSFTMYDQKFSILESVDILEQHLNNCINHDDFMPKLLSFLRKEYGEIKLVQPNNWKKYLKNPGEVQELITEKQYKDDFKGTISDIGSYGWQDFVESISFSTLEYNRERGRPVFQTMVQSILNQGYATQIHNNTVEIIKDLDTIFKEKFEPIDIIKESNKSIHNTTKILSCNCVKPRPSGRGCKQSFL